MSRDGFVVGRIVALSGAAPRRDLPSPLTDTVLAATRSDKEKPMPRDGEIIAEKSFHYGNLKLRIIYEMDLYSLEIYRVNESSYHNLWGIFEHEADAREVFDRVRL